MEREDREHERKFELEKLNRQEREKERELNFELEKPDYEHVKSVILREYELVPEAYRQRLNKYKIKSLIINHMLNSYDSERKKICLISGLGLRNLMHFFCNLRQVILLEEFKDCVLEDLKTHLEDKKVKTLEEAAVISDIFILSHKKYFFSQDLKITIILKVQTLVTRVF